MEEVGKVIMERKRVEEENLISSSVEALVRQISGSQGCNCVTFPGRTQKSRDRHGWAAQSSRTVKEGIPAC